MLIIVMHNSRGYLESLAALVNTEGITDTTIVERKNIGSSLIGDSTSYVFHRGGIVDEYDKALIAILKEGDTNRFLAVMEDDTFLKLSNSNGKGFICSIPFQQIENAGLESFHAKKSGKSTGDYLSKDRISLDLTTTDKNDAIKEISVLLRNAGQIADFDTFLKDALEREAIESTAVNNEIAIPHARSKAVTDIVVAFGRSKEGIEFGASDGKRVKLIFLVGTPKGTQVNAYLEILADLSRNLQKRAFRDLLLKATSPEEVIGIFRGADSSF